jgi:peroxiredoxin Q/BCP
VRAGDLAPDFTLSDQDGAARSLRGFLDDGPVVLFFYPAANTTGCTREACHFRDLGARFIALGATRVGVSMDDVARQRDFATVNGFDFALLSDVDGDVARLYGVKRSWNLLKVRRSTFVIMPDQRVLAVIASELSMHAHADRALEVLAASA